MTEFESKITGGQPSEQMLHAYLDDELPLKLRLEVAKWLLNNPDAASNLQKTKLNEEILRLSFRFRNEDGDGLSDASWQPTLIGWLTLNWKVFAVGTVFGIAIVVSALAVLSLAS